MNRDSPDTAIALFVRTPTPGRVKTRLGYDMGHENACDFYQAMVADILSTISFCRLPVFLFHDGADSAGLPDEWRNTTHALVAQKGNSIGDRMAAAFDHLFSLGVRRVAVIGSDIPGMDHSLIDAAFQALATVDAAIAPAVDGGYCLIALTNESFRRRVFQEIAWSTDQVLQTTLDRFEECGLRVARLECRRDIDTIEDLIEYCRNPAATARATNRWLAAHGYISLSVQAEPAKLYP